ncbi:glycosyltransferase family 2 protein [Empedobacter sp. GD03739]|uniref:glycosyltransferase family 2 protein n=1 Tax=Empedobacter sp. GD03739 TaxID=2975376 RepID=UPI002447CE4A|nr:glycosyltransferase family 2 protein [Empedobacter sp. GD03739]MDH1603618.1 glycosyltransferase family 2 protein [Empedobacter sp. GD03739]
MEVNKDTKKSLISVIVPIYNTEEYLKKCLNSIKNQIYTNFEVLLINDGSTDNSLDICLEFVREDDRFFIKNIINKGVSNARNLGIIESKGNYLVFIDSDDWVDSKYLQDFVNNIPENEEFIIIQNAYDELNGCRTLKFNFESSHYKLDEDFFHLFYDKVDFEYGYLWNKFFIRSIIINNNLKFDIDKKLFEDEEFYYQYLEKIKTIITLESANYNYVKRENSAIHKKKKIEDFLMKVCLRLELLNRCYLRKMINKDQLNLLSKKYINRNFTWIFQDFFMNIDEEERLDNLSKASSFVKQNFKFFNRTNKRLYLILILIRFKHYKIASFLINKTQNE